MRQIRTWPLSASHFHPVYLVNATQMEPSPLLGHKSSHLLCGLYPRLTFFCVDMGKQQQQQLQLLLNN